MAGTLGVFAYSLVLQGMAIASAAPQLLAPDGAAALFLQRLASWAAQIVGAVSDGVLALFFMATTMFFIDGDWPCGAGIFDLISGDFVVVGLCDCLVRTKLVGGDEATSTWMMFVALFGGIKLFGVIGISLSPLLLGFALAALRLYERTPRFRLRAGAL